MMRGSLPQELTFTTVLTSLLSLVLILRLLYPKSSLWKLSNYCFWKWTSHDFFSWNWTWHDFFSWNWSLIFVFTCLLIATSTLFGIWGKKSHRVFEVLSQLSWLNGLSVQGVALFRICYVTRSLDPGIPIYSIFVPMFVSIAITLQVVGFVIWDRNTNTGLCVAFSGGCLFHTFAMVVFSYLLYKHKELRHRKILFTALVYVLCAAASYSLKFVDDSDTFLQANCILQCCTTISFLVVYICIESPQPVKERVIATISQDNNSRSSKDSYDTDMEENAGRGQFPIQTERAVLAKETSTQTAQLSTQLLLPTPLPSDIQLSHWNPLRCCVLDIQKMEHVSTRVLAEWETQDGIRVLRFEQIDWKTLNQNWEMQLKQHVPENAYRIAQGLSVVGSRDGLMIWANKDLEDVGLCAKDCDSLMAGDDLQISKQTGIVYNRWMYSLPRNLSP